MQFSLFSIIILSMYEYFHIFEKKLIKRGMISWCYLLYIEKNAKFFYVIALILNVRDKPFTLFLNAIFISLEK